MSYISFKKRKQATAKEVDSYALNIFWEFGNPSTKGIEVTDSTTVQEIIARVIKFHPKYGMDPSFQDKAGNIRANFSLALCWESNNVIINSRILNFFDCPLHLIRQEPSQSFKLYFKELTTEKNQFGAKRNFVLNRTFQTKFNQTEQGKRNERLLWELIKMEGLNGFRVFYQVWDS